MESIYSKADACKPESSQSCESRAQSDVSAKAHSKQRAFNLFKNGVAVILNRLVCHFLIQWSYDFKKGDTLLELEDNYLLRLHGSRRKCANVETCEVICRSLESTLSL